MAGCRMTWLDRPGWTDLAWLLLLALVLVPAPGPDSHYGLIIDSLLTHLLTQIEARIDESRILDSESQKPGLSDSESQKS